MRQKLVAVIVMVLLIVGSLVSPLQNGVKAATTIPTYDHVVIVMEENKAGSKIIGDRTNAPYINSLADGGVNFTDFHANYHPSQLNYINLFSGSNQGVTSNTFISPKLTADNLGGQLIAAGKSIADYSETMPYEGYEGDTYQNPSTGGWYKSKHNPARAFADIPSSANKTFSQFPSDYTQLPTVSLVIPDQNNDMHDGSIKTGDTWLQNKIDGYAQWAKTHNSLLIVTWDEDDLEACSSICTTTPDKNKIATVFYGAHLKNGTQVTTAYGSGHRSILKTLETMYGLPYVSEVSSVPEITEPWDTQAPPNVPASPANFWSDTVTQTSATLHWDLSSGATSYKISRNGTLVHTATATETNWVDNGLTANTYYNWKIVASNDSGDSAAKDAYTTTPAGETVQPPSPVSNFWQSGGNATSAKLNWYLSTGATSYRIEQNGTTIATVDGTTTSLQLTNLTPSTYYNWKIYAVNSAGESTATNAYFTTPVGGIAPDAPENFWSDNGTATSIKLHWTEVTGIDHYIVYQNGVTIYEGNMAPDWSNILTLQLTNLQASTYYHWEIKAIASTGTESAIKDAYFTTPAQ